ncbi:flavodoxin family protein [Lentzea aerocolonigenes]|jgi:multimeric flavodoxin WrbA|uniref:flavodoxin family protein n=1 Tax=Lentzea aerocolonigenes TaxID=68170 RepID=UPI0004C434D9|nr:flavodoxin family protein [Lentzea aerocolonigenes]MCP2241888.1 Multimeric flavodoxin WrbA [Lentzea aerocolonigenes]
MSSPKIVAIHGSERNHGNTADVLEYVGKVLAARGVELEVVRLGDLRMSPCGPCGDCNSRTVPCALEDDIPGVVEQMARADGILYTAPVHGFGTGALMQAFIERSGVGFMRFERPLTNKVGGVIVIGRRYSHTEVYHHLTANVLLNRMIMIGSGFPAIVYGNQPGDVLHDDEGLQMVERMVNRMVDLVHVLREHRELTGRDGLDTELANERDDKWFAARHSPIG